MGERTRRVVFGSAALIGLGCSGGDLTPPPTSGSVTITTSTTGQESDADGYAVAIDGGTETAIPASGTLQRDNVEPGDHSIRLDGADRGTLAASGAATLDGLPPVWSP